MEAAAQPVYRLSFPAPALFPPLFFFFFVFQGITWEMRWNGPVFALSCLSPLPRSPSPPSVTLLQVPLALFLILYLPFPLCHVPHQPKKSQIWHFDATRTSLIIHRAHTGLQETQHLNRITALARGARSMAFKWSNNLGSFKKECRGTLCGNNKWGSAWLWSKAQQIFLPNTFSQHFVTEFDMMGLIQWNLSTSGLDSIR